ncbi:MAG: hypothetical protein ABI584_05255 [Acidobacteriota bacterium]
MRATRKSWKTEPLPARRARLALERRFDAAELAAVRRGLVPEEMEDKWFVFEERGRLYFHRSWTGFCVYEVVLKKTRSGADVVEAWVNRDPEQYSATDDAYDARLLAWMIDALLLKRDAPWPESGKDDEPLRQWSLVGRAMLEHDGDGRVAEELDKALGKTGDGTDQE